MNIKQSLSTICQALTNAIGHHLLGYLPTSGEIQNDEVKSLANRLKAGSYKETLTNILEWQERNIVFWTEREPIWPLLVYIYAIFLAALGIFLVGFLVIFRLIRLNIHVITWFNQTIWLFFTIWIAMLAGSTLAILATVISILHFNRKFPWKEIPRGLKNVFWPSISMNFLLEKKLGVCRDYAKLTACLLSNIDPPPEIYFASAPHHVATGVYIENRLYMLDQRLPILTKDRWDDYRNPKKSDGIQRFDPIKMTLKADKRTFLNTKDKAELNTENLAKRMTKLLNIKGQQGDKTSSLQKPVQILWKNGDVLYEENEMVDYSLARWLETKISSEVVRINQVTKIETSRCKHDLIFQIHVSKDE